MGCDKYCLKDDDESYIMFSESDDTFGCLCTFPHNYFDGKLDRDVIRSLALLGAAVVLNRHGDLELPVYLPYSIPEWIIDELFKYLPVEDYDKEK